MESATSSPAGTGTTFWQIPDANNRPHEMPRVARVRTLSSPFQVWVGETVNAVVGRVGRTAVADRAVDAEAGSEEGRGQTAGAGPAGPVRHPLVLHAGIQWE